MPTPITPEDIASQITNVGARVATNEDRLKAVEDALKAKPSPEAPKAPSIMRIARGLVTGKWEGIEADIFARQDEIKRTLMQTGSNSVGGYVIPPEYTAKLIDLLTAKSVLAQAGMSNVPAKGSPYTLPRLASGTTFAYTAETGSAGQTNPTFEQVSVTPKQFSGYCAVTRLAAEISDPGLEQVVTARLTGDAALLVDYTALFGAGGNAPTGLVNDGDVEATALNAVPTIDHCEAALARLETDNGIVDESKVAWVMPPWLWHRLRIEKASTAGSYQLAPDKTAKTPRSLLGYPVFLTSQISMSAASGVANEGYIFLGDWSQMAHVTWGNLAVETSTQAGSAFVDHQLYIKLVGWNSFARLHPQSFQILSDCR